MGEYRVATSHIGGGAGALDNIDGADLSDGHKAVVVEASGQVWWYNLDADSGLSEDSTNYSVIFPDANAGTKRWILVGKTGRVLIPDSTIDQGDNAIVGTLAWHVANASSNPTTVTIPPGTHTISTSVTIAATMTLKFEHGGILKAGIYQIFNWGTGSGALSLKGTLLPQWIGVVGDGDGAGGGTDNSTAMQKVLDLIEGNTDLILDIPRAIYRFDSAITLLRDASGDNKRLIIKGNGSTFDFSSMGTTGTAFKIGATGSGVVADDGEISLRDFYMLGPESANPISGSLGTPTAPDGSTVGLYLDYALNVNIDNVVVKRFYTGLYSHWVFPIQANNLSLHQNYINFHMIDINTLGVFNNLSLKEGRYGGVIKSTYADGSLSSQTFNGLHIEGNHIGFVIDPGQEGNTSGLDDPANQYNGILINNPYIASNDGDVFRLGYAWTFASPSSRGADADQAMNILSNFRLIGGRWNYNYTISTIAPIVFDTSGCSVGGDVYTGGAVHGAYVDVPVEMEHIIGTPRNTTIITSPRQQMADYVATDRTVYWYSSDGTTEYERTETGSGVHHYAKTANLKALTVGLYDADENMPRIIKDVNTVDLGTPATSFSLYTVPANSTLYVISVQVRCDTALTATNGDYLSVGVDAANRRVDFGVSSVAAASAHAKNVKIRWLNSSELTNQVAVAAEVIKLMSVDANTDAAALSNNVGGSSEQVTVVITGWLIPDLDDA
ncbi:MAG: hypothetical protein ACYSSO_11695 [Planctomycetota bacterium]|jgi:hypothetical protein